MLFVVFLLLICFSRRRALYDYGPGARATRRAPMLRPFDPFHWIPFLHRHLECHAHNTGARRPSGGSRRPAGVPFPCRYYTAPVRHQHQLPWTFYIGLHSRFPDRPTIPPTAPLLPPAPTTAMTSAATSPTYDPFLAATIRPRRHRQRPPVRTLCTVRRSRRANRPTLSSPTPNGPGVTANDDYF